MAVTPNYSWAYPTVNADADAWGTELNNMAIAIDASLKTVDDSVAAKLVKASNLSDLASASTARTNLGLGTAAVKAASDSAQTTVVTYTGTAPTDQFIPYLSVPGGGAFSLAVSAVSLSTVMVKSDNLSGLSSASTSRTNLGLGSIATHNVTVSTSAPSGGSDGDIWLQYT